MADATVASAKAWPLSMGDSPNDAVEQSDRQYKTRGGAPPDFDMSNLRRGKVQSSRDSFTRLLERALALGLDRVVASGGVQFRIATMCSGTDAPILALRELQDAGLARGDNAIDFEHVFSCEIEAFKQAFIERNARPSGEIFRNVLEIGEPTATQATTAHGALADIPLDIDILVAGSSCVDFSRLASNKNDLLANSGLYTKAARGHKPCDPAVHDPDFDGLLDSIWENIAEEGESAKTFFSLIQYIKKSRPMIVIIENVIGAPWKSLENFWFPKVQYAARFVRINSNEFLVPQVRHRGYLIAVDHTQFEEESDKIVQTWASLMSEVNWRDECPSVSQFLLPRSDPRIIAARYASEKSIAQNLSRESEAPLSLLRHAEARRVDNLGNSNPYTGMDARGRLRPRDDTWQAWIQSKGHRVQDLLDISYLRNIAKKDIDMSHKMMIIDLSQNVDRTSGTIGVLGCITPSGIPYLTYQGRPILGIEALALQGIPIDRINTSIETQAQLQDMAGNAMTTTVVGAAILFAIIAEREQMTQVGRAKQGLCKPLDPPSMIRRRLLGSSESLEDEAHYDPPEWEENRSFSTADFDVKGVDGDCIRRLYLKGRQYCPCQAFRKDGGKRQDELFKCVDCQEVRCGACKGNPVHKFEKFEVDVKFLQEFKGMPRGSMTYHQTVGALKRLLPGRFRLRGGDKDGDDDVLLSPSNLPQLKLASFSNTFPPSHVQGLWDATLACFDSVYYFDRVSINSNITVSYVSSEAHIQLVISERSITWLVYLHEDCQHAKNLARDIDYEATQPLIRAVLNSSAKSILPCSQDWQWFIRKTLKLSVKTKETRSGVKIALQGVRIADWIWKVPGTLLEVLGAKINGHYIYTDKCGVSHNALYVSLDEKGEPATFLMRNPAPTTAGSEDLWAIVEDPRKLDSTEHRETLCNFPENYNHPRHESKGGRYGRIEHLNCSSQGYWTTIVHDDGNYCTTENPLSIIHPANKTVESLHVAQTLRFPDERCMSSPFLQLRLPVGSLPFLTQMYREVFSTSGNAFAICAIKNGNGERWMRVPKQDHNGFLSTLSFAFNKIKIVGPVVGDPRFLQQGEMRTIGCIEHCEKCAPTLPAVHRLRNEDGKVESRFEDCEEARKYERAMHNRPPALQLDVQLANEGGERRTGSLYSDSKISDAACSDLYVRFLVNPTTLAHQAMSYLPADDRIGGYRRNNKEMELTFNIKLQDIPTPTSGFRPFSDAVTSTSGSSDAEQPPSFAYTGQMLSEQQLNSVMWMLRREKGNVEKDNHPDNPKFMEKELEELVVPAVDMRLTGYASVPNYARGGVLAHDVGFGKTVVTLALIDFQRDSSMATQTQEHSDEERLEWTGTGHKHLKATLIIVPPQIVGQWEAQAQKFLVQHNPKGVNILTITSFEKISPEVMEEADIIIASASLFDLRKSAYRNRLSVAAGVPGVHDMIDPRDLNDWYRDVLDGLASHHTLFQTDDANLKDVVQARKDRHESNLAAATAARVLPSSRKEGANSKKATKRPNKIHKPERAAPLGSGCQLDPLEIRSIFRGGQLLQLYSFRRVVLDEFSYDNPHLALFFHHCIASSKWVLSGTPPMADLGEVCVMAKLVGIHIARPEPSVPDYFPSITKGPSLSDLSSSEFSRGLANTKSTDFALARHNQAGAFIHQWIRKNPIDLSKFKVKEVVIFCKQDTISFVAYNQVQRLLYKSNWDVQRVPAEFQGLVCKLVEAETNAKSQSSKASMPLRSAWSQAVKSLLLRASVSLNDYKRQMLAIGMVLEHDDNTREVLEKQVLFYEERLRSLSKTFKSLFDESMFLAGRLLQDPILRDMRKQHPRAQKQSAMLAHFREIVDTFKLQSPASFGGTEIMYQFLKIVLGPGYVAGDQIPDEDWEFENWHSWNNGHGTHHVLDWWRLADDDVDDEDVKKDVARIGADSLIPFDEWMESNNNGGLGRGQLLGKWYDITMGLSDERTVDHYLKTYGLNPKPFETLDRRQKRVELHRDGKTTAEDYRFGVKLLAAFPKYGQSIAARSTQIDVGLEAFVALLQSIETAQREWKECYQELRLQRQIIALLSCCSLTCEKCGMSALKVDTNRNPICTNCPSPGHVAEPTEPHRRVGIRCPCCMNYGHIHNEGVLGGLGYCLMLTCGHMLDYQCFTKFQEVCKNGVCPVPDCGCIGTDAAVPMEKLSRISYINENSLPMLDSSPKIIKIRQEIEKVLHDPATENDKVLVFVQFNEVKKQLKAELEDARISVLETIGEESDSAVIESFQAGNATVLIQNLMSSESAGSNLEIANHVMFAAPLFAEKGCYDQYMRQAKGRAIREGQQKEVKIYHFLTKHTIEVDIMQWRLKQRLMLHPDGTDRIQLPESPFLTNDAFGNHIGLSKPADLRSD